MGLFDYRMEGTQPQGMLQDLIKRYKAGVTERVGLLKQDPVGYLSQAAMEGLPPMPDIGQNPDGTIRRNPDDPATKWLADNVGFGALTVYHGSPHKFSKFDMSKIGTGEGAGTYGHGLYMAESPKVARSYRAALSDFGLPDGEDVTGIARILASEGNNRGEFLARRAYAKSENLDDLIAQAKKAINEKSSLFKADIPDDQIGKMIDWDATEQPQFVKDALADVVEGKRADTLAYRARFDAKVKAMGKQPMRWPDEIDIKGQNLYWELEKKLGSADAASAELRRRGIPGLKYFDGQSRKAAEGTRNFVLFDDQLPRILERNGVPTGAQPWQPGEYELLRHAPK